PTGLGAGQREGRLAGVGSAGGQRGDRRSQLLVAGVTAAADGGRGDAVGTLLPQEYRPRAQTFSPTQRGALPHRDEQRSVGGAVWDQADLGQGLVAPVSPDHPQDPQPYGAGLYQLPGWSLADAARCAGRVKLARGVSYACRGRAVPRARGWTFFPKSWRFRSR